MGPVESIHTDAALLICAAVMHCGMRLCVCVVFNPCVGHMCVLPEPWCQASVHDDAENNHSTMLALFELPPDAAPFCGVPVAFAVEVPPSVVTAWPAAPSFDKLQTNTTTRPVSVDRTQLTDYLPDDRREATHDPKRRHQRGTRRMPTADDSWTRMKKNKCPIIC